MSPIPYFRTSLKLTYSIQLRATHYLESLARCGRASCDGFDRHGSGQLQPRLRLPYVTLDRLHPQKPWIRAACRMAACVLETNIRTLPDSTSHTASNISDMLSLEIENARVLGDAGKHNYLYHPLSNAVDAKPSTVFRSLHGTPNRPKQCVLPGRMTNWFE